MAVNSGLHPPTGLLALSITQSPHGDIARWCGMMTRIKMQHARAGAAAIAVALALSPTYAAAPKPIVDLSKSPAVTGKADAAPAAKRSPSTMIGGVPVEDRTLEIGGGALAILALGGIGLALRSRKRRRDDEAAWDYAATEPVADEPAAEEPLTLSQPVAEQEPALVEPEPSAFAWNKGQPCDNPSDDGSDRCPGETWVDRAYRGPSPANPSVSLKARLHRAAFFDKREREVAAGKAEPIDPDAGLPEAMVEEQEREIA